MQIDEHVLEVAQANGEAVAKVYGDPTVKQLFAELDQRYFRLWKASTSVEERERIFGAARALSDLDTAFEAVIQAGTLATRDLAQRDT